MSRLGWIVAVLLAALPARAEDAEETLSVLILPLAADGVDAALAATVGNLVAGEMVGRPGLAIISTADLDAMLEAERLKDLAGCNDVSCASEIAGAVNADRILTGSIGRIGGALVLTLRWLAPVDGLVLGVAVERSSDEMIDSAVRRALAQLFDGAAPADAETRRVKRGTFWTVEASLGSGIRNGAEPYDAAIGGTLRLAFGGRQAGTPFFFNGVLGAGLARYWGDSRGLGGRVTYSRVDLDPYLDLRAGFGLGRSRAARLYGTLGAGLNVGWHQATQSVGLETEDRAVFPELRFGLGGWYRVSDERSVFMGYRYRWLFAGEGADSASEMVALGSTPERWGIHELELGAALHF